MFELKRLKSVWRIFGAGEHQPTNQPCSIETPDIYFTVYNAILLCFNNPNERVIHF